MDIISVSEILQRRDKLDFNILKINIQFDILRLQEAVLSILRQHTPVLKDGYKTYSGLGLQYANSSNPIYDCVEQTSFIHPSGKSSRLRSQESRDFVNKNELAIKLNFLFDAFFNVPLFRGRILKAAPGHIHDRHIDGARDCRIHIPVFTNQECKMCFDEGSYHLESEGQAFLCNTSRPHNFVNLGSDERVHIVFVI